MTVKFPIKSLMEQGGICDVVKILLKMPGGGGEFDFLEIALRTGLIYRAGETALS